MVLETDRNMQYIVLQLKNLQSKNLADSQILFKEMLDFLRCLYACIPVYLYACISGPIGQKVLILNFERIHK